MKATGDKVFINGKEYELGERIGGGLEGSVFAVNGLPSYVIKVIKSENKSLAEKQAILEHLLWLKNIIGANDDLKQKLAIPKGILDDEIGYVMVRASEHDSLKKYLSFPTDPSEFMKWYKNNYRLKKRLQIITFMFNALENIHISGLLFTDLSPNNIMVHRDKNNLVFIDTDNMRRKTDAYLSVLGTEGYMAPEIYAYLKNNVKLQAAGCPQGELSKSGKLSIESDVFSAAIIAFQLLTLQHPFIGDIIEDGSAEDEAAAYRCETDYVLHRNKTNESTTLPFVGFLDECKIVTPEIKELFYRTFVDGKNNPHLRPTAMEFAEAFAIAQDRLVKCSSCGAEFIYTMGKKNECWDCNTISGNKIVLEIYNGYDEKNRAKLVAQILNKELFLQSDYNYKFVHVSSIVLEEGKSKYLYLRHFDRAVNRGKHVAVLTLLDAHAGTIRMDITDLNAIPECYLIDRANTKARDSINHIKRGKEFSADKYAIEFEITNSRIGKIQTIGCFLRT